jgi:hypothetical protein
VSERGAEVRADAGGQLLVEARQPGRYELRTAAGKRRQFEVSALPPPLEVAGPWEASTPESARIGTMNSGRGRPVPALSVGTSRPHPGSCGVRRQSEAATALWL